MTDLYEQQELLEKVLRYHSETNEFFTTGQRIMINQHRAHIYKQMQNSELEDYQQSIEIESQIYKCLAKIRKTKWKPKPYENEY